MSEPSIVSEPHGYYWWCQTCGDEGRLLYASAGEARDDAQFHDCDETED